MTTAEAADNPDPTGAPRPSSRAPMASRDRIDALLDRVAADIAALRPQPEATYRLQFHKDFNFRAAAAINSYLADLGISHVYASPYLKARPGSQHGYDIIDHQALNPEIGSDGDYTAWIDELHRHDLGQVFDMVPNHMGIVGNANAWWNDVLENGPASPYARFFDIDWHSSLKEQLRDKVLLPVLGDTYGQVLVSGQLRVSYEAGAFAIHYFDHRFPVAPCSYAKLLEHRLPELEKVLGTTALQFLEYRSIVTAVKHLPSRTDQDPERRAERLREKEVIKRRLAALSESCAEVRDFIGANVTLFNGISGDSPSFDLLDELLNAQAYRLSFWRVAADEINYRRFFDINELAALSMEQPEVFAATHRLVLRLLAEDKIDGLRIDHPDGLFDPREYLERLQVYSVLERARRTFAAEPVNGSKWEDVAGEVRAAIEERRHRGDAWLQRPLYVVVEKILGRGEPLPDEWPVHGTTGYEFLNALNGLFVDASHATHFSRLYFQWTAMDPAYRPYVYEKKLLILGVALSSELQVLGHQLSQLSEKNRWSRDFTLNSLRNALRHIIAFFPVYRSYIRDENISLRDRLHVQQAVAQAQRRNPAMSASLFTFVRDVLLQRRPEGAGDDFAAEQRRFVGKFQQVTAPVMAKGVEDTAFYVYNRLLSLNEVGGDPEQFGVAPAAFHRANQERRAHWPRGLSATATHDTKRGEDLRARLNVLSELPGEWRKCLIRWARLNKRHRTALEETDVPERNEEYLIYQTLIGAWPIEPVTPEQYANSVERIQAYVQKALHEAKVFTSWINPRPPYDDAVRRFVTRILDVRHGKRFLEDLRLFQRRIHHCGFFNSLAQLLLKIVSPGVPDIYQGTELWDLSLVDPDNRRPVNYERRRQMLDELKERSADAGELGQLARELTEHKEDGRIKLYVTWKALHCRRQHPGLFAAGDYVPIEAQGPRRDNVVALLRRQGSTLAVAAVPRLITQLVAQAGDLPVGEAVWHDTLLPLSDVAPGRRWRDVFTGEGVVTGSVNGASLRAADVFQNFPVALLLAEQ
jgi:(1->4)-alpha-D-glucan 1-alpha-D-glucosylmutase